MKELHKTQIDLSEIQLSEDQSIQFTCYVECETELSMIVQDELGRSQLQKRVPLRKGINELHFDLTKFEGGVYDAWIDVFDETFIRRLEIQGRHEPSMFSKVKQWLNLL